MAVLTFQAIQTSPDEHPPAVLWGLHNFLPHLTRGCMAGTHTDPQSTKRRKVRGTLTPPWREHGVRGKKSVVILFPSQKTLSKMSTFLSKETGPKIKQFVCSCWLC